MNKNEAILIEDEDALRIATVQTLELSNFKVQVFRSAEHAQAQLRSGFPGVVITDVRLPGKSGLELLVQIVEMDPDLPVIVVTGHGDVSMAVLAMRAGAYDFIEKPFSSERLMETVRRAQEKRRLFLDNMRLKAAWASLPTTPPLLGESNEIERIRTFIRTIGPTNADVLINGQTGTGKEVVACQLHAASNRKGPFVAINCGALPESVFESEIFGHEAGAFTSAQKRRVGKLEYANGGTVFLDEIESMPLALQVKLLRVLQERKLERLGGNIPIPVDCRIIAASKMDLLKLSEQGLFREDLYYRIGVVVINLPRLSDRRGDIPLLLAHFIQGALVRYQREIPPLDPHRMAQWQARDWPGNVRELRNFADRLVLGIADNESFNDDLIEDIKTNQNLLSTQVKNYERKLIVDALKSVNENVAEAAHKLGIPEKTLYDKIKKGNLLGK